MPQTLLGLLGLMTITLISVNQQRVTSRGYEARLHEEYDLAASGVMMHVVELIASRSFDEETTPDKIHQARRVPQEADEFSMPETFGYDGPCDLERPALTPDCDDVDDLAGTRQQLVHAQLRGDKTLPFYVDIDVYYVDDADLETPVTWRTKNKRVVLTASTPLAPGVELVRLERVVSYDPVKAEADYEAEHGILAET